MFKMQIKPQWQLTQRARGARPALALPAVLDICALIHEHENLAEACRRLGLSYRHGWGILRAAQQAFGAPLVASVRGQGARLTELGSKLLWADRRIAARLSPVLDALASELEAELERVLVGTPAILRVHASHGFAVAALRDALVEQQFPIELKYVNSQEALASLARGDCDIAGFHVPLGKYQTPALTHYQPWIATAGLHIINLATRRQGIMVAPGNPKRVRALADLTRVRFINRQAGSGTRMLLDLLLKDHAVDCAQIAGYETIEYTHAAVAAYIASGMADAGFGIETAARQFQLDFIEIATERYFLCAHANALTSAPLRYVLDLLRSRAFKACVNQLPGYNGATSGAVASLGETFPELARVSREQARRRRGR